MDKTFGSLSEQGRQIMCGDGSQMWVDTFCNVTLNGKRATLLDLMPGDALVVDREPALNIAATRGDQKLPASAR